MSSLLNSTLRAISASYCIDTVRMLNPGQFESPTTAIKKTFNQQPRLNPMADVDYWGLSRQFWIFHEQIITLNNHRLEVVGFEHAN